MLMNMSLCRGSLFEGPTAMMFVKRLKVERLVPQGKVAAVVE